jgi:hypothetical protein
MVYEIHIKNLKSEKSQDYAQKPHQKGTFMNSASVQITWILSSEKDAICEGYDGVLYSQYSRGKKV